MQPQRLLRSTQIQVWASRNRPIAHILLVDASPLLVHTQKIPSVGSDQSRAHLHHLALSFQHEPQYPLIWMSPSPGNSCPPPVVQTPVPLRAISTDLLGLPCQDLSPPKLGIPESDSNEQSKYSSAALPAEPTSDDRATRTHSCGFLNPEYTFYLSFGRSSLLDRAPSMRL